MPSAAIDLTLAHSPDPDDAFMWWPITGKIAPPSAAEINPTSRPRVIEPPALDTGPLRFHALPADIEALNRRARHEGDLDITALSVRTWADVRQRYAITRCGASFGDAYGPKVVARVGDARINCHNCLKPPAIRLAIPGRGTTAFMMLGMLLGSRVIASDSKFVEMPFEQIIGAVARGEVDAGLVIHEGQVTFADQGLRLVIDVGQWWKQRTGLKLPLGINAIRGDLDDRFGPGTQAQVSELLSRSVAHAMSRWDESVRYTLPFAEANVRRGGGEPPTLERIDRYCRLYVTEETRDMGEAGRSAIARLLSEGAAAGLCPTVESIDLV